MNKTPYALLLVLLGLLPLLLGGSQVTTHSALAPAAADCTLYGRLPVLIVDVSGGTLLGPVHTHLAVYRDGTASYSTLTGLGSLATVEVAQLSVKDVDGLVADIRAANAFSLCDQEMLVSDVPLTTVTVFGDGQQTRAHSFSYWIGTGEYTRVAGILNSLLGVYFR